MFPNDQEADMKKYIRGFILVVIFTNATLHQGKAQDLGLSFSYFIPKNGYFSVPVTPFSLRGIGFDITRFLSVETGFTLYRMSGMGVRELPFESHKPLIGPFFAIMVPAELVIGMNLGGPVFKLKGGGFGFFNFDTRVNEGNLESELLAYTGWEVLNSSYSAKNAFGYGYLFGAELFFYLTKKFGLSLEAYYMSGFSSLDMKGSYTGIPIDGDPLTYVEENFPDAKLDYTGYEFSIGVIFTP